MEECVHIFHEILPTASVTRPGTGPHFLGQAAHHPSDLQVCLDESLPSQPPFGLKRGSHAFVPQVGLVTGAENQNNPSP